MLKTNLLIVKIMDKILVKNRLLYIVALILSGICTMNGQPSVKTNVRDDANKMPVYGHWRNFTTKDGLPSDHVYCVRIDGDRVLAGTHDGLAVYENGKWKSYTTKDGLPHRSEEHTSELQSRQ